MASSSNTISSRTSESNTRPRSMRGLVALNAVLLAALAFVTFSQSLTAQGGYRAAGSYIAVPGNVPGWAPSVIYIVDQTNQQMIGLTFDPNTKTLQGVGARDLARDAAQFGSSRN